MSRKYQIRDQDELYFVTFTIVRWIDVFTRDRYRDIFIDSLKFCQDNKGLEVYAFVIMTNHVHLIIGRKGKSSLQGIIRDVKKYTAVKILEAIEQNTEESRRDWLLYFFERAGSFKSSNTKYQFWQHHSHPLELNSTRKMINYLNYIHQNPVKAGIVYQPEDYVYSSAANYAGMVDKVLDVKFIG
ncbi:REP-associated tyrosine transposase [Echinicola rosea]|uniref:Transposase n=1 Tax=Echinicola rosea TaxID=1807691 RepID=A0ABQ1UQ46_9BACT|nr:transposase [Echinicola rosea]GGF22710.1 transposase [Echinicola rosea]